uniref:Uncharacterized protein n=1 Tax=Rhodnius prolixus TaxID=13249 RepID=T1HQY8_RHOPR
MIHNTKSPKLKACVNNATDAIEPCLDEGERVHKGVFLEITDSLINFICYKEGDRIACEYQLINLRD